MERMEQFICRNWLWLIIGLVLTRKAVEYAYIERGYIAFGSEWLVLPFFLAVVNLVRNVKDQIGEFLHGEDKDD